MPDMRWTSGARHARCIPCDTDRESELVLESPTASGGDLSVTRCPVCGSYTIADGEPEPEPDDARIDRYLFAEGGIDAMVRDLYRGDHPDGATFLDIGANYGFALRYARDVLGWSVLGAEPSYAGRRGADELGVEILDQYVDSDSAIGGPFDVILASEVVEHVPDPHVFLRVLRAHTAPSGTVLITTPDAAIIAPETEGAAQQAVHAGGHRFIASAAALQRMLHDAGFASVAVEHVDNSLVAAASPADGRELTVADHGPTRHQMVDFYAIIADDESTSLTLRAAMESRRFRELVALGEASTADEVRLLDRLRPVVALDFGDPAAARSTVAADAPPHVVIAPVAFAMAMRRLVAGDDLDRAVQYFALAEEAIESLLRHEGMIDGDARMIRREAPPHRLIALVRVDADAAGREWMRLRRLGALAAGDPWTTRLAADAIALGVLDRVDAGARASATAGGLADDLLAAGADAYIDALWRRDDARVTSLGGALDAMLAERRGERAAGSPSVPREPRLAYVALAVAKRVPRRLATRILPSIIVDSYGAYVERAHRMRS